MFGFKKKQDKPFEVDAPITGKCISITEVQDEVFSKKMVGDGFAIEPSKDANEVVSPIDGTIVALPETKHAIGIKSEKYGLDILVHIGLNTVNLGGKGFEPKIKLNQVVKAGQPIMELDRDYMNSKNVDMTTMVIFTDGYKEPINIGKKKDLSMNEGQPILKQA